MPGGDSTTLAPTDPDLPDLDDPSSPNQARARQYWATLDANAQPRPDDNPDAATLRRALQDRQHLAGIVALVDRWPALDADQRDSLAALLNPRRNIR